jgi:hypothetical protein
VPLQVSKGLRPISRNADASTLFGEPQGRNSPESHYLTAKSHHAKTPR